MVKNIFCLCHFHELNSSSDSLGMCLDLFTCSLFLSPSPFSLRLRALSGGGGGANNSVASPPLSPALPKYKLADYRYGREEMLALYVKDNKVRK